MQLVILYVILKLLKVLVQLQVQILHLDLPYTKVQDILQHCHHFLKVHQHILDSEPPTTDTLRVLESQGSWVVASVSQLNLPSYPHSSYGSYIVYLSTFF